MGKFLREAGVAAAIMAAAAAIYWDSLKLKASTYDPLGSGTMPRMVAVAIIVLSLVVLAQGAVAAFLAPPRSAAQEPIEFERRPWLAVAIFGYMTAATILLQFRAPFGLTGSLFLFASIMTIRRFQPRSILPAAACSAAVSYGLTYLFGRLFGVDLP